MSNGAHLRSVQTLLAHLPPASGFEPYSLVAFAYPEDEGGEYLRRSFRYEFGTCCTHLTVEAPRRSVWRARMLRDLARTGYEPWLALDDSADVRRWLRGAAERRRELAFLQELGVRGDAARWPRRPLRSAPPANKRRRESHEAWMRVARQVCDVGFWWDDVSLCLSRFGRRAGPTASDKLGVRVSVIPYVTGPSTRLFHVSAHVWVPGRGSRRRPLAPRVAHVFSRTLRAAGFIRGRVGYERTFRNAGDAARTCRKVFDELMSVTIPGPRHAR